MILLWWKIVNFVVRIAGGKTLRDRAIDLSVIVITSPRRLEGPPGTPLDSNKPKPYYP